MSGASRKLGVGGSDGLAGEYTDINTTPVQCTYFVPTFAQSLSVHP